MSCSPPTDLGPHGPYCGGLGNTLYVVITAVDPGACACLAGAGGTIAWDITSGTWTGGVASGCGWGLVISWRPGGISEDAPTGGVFIADGTGGCTLGFTSDYGASSCHPLVWSGYVLNPSECSGCSSDLIVSITDVAPPTMANPASGRSTSPGHTTPTTSHPIHTSPQERVCGLLSDTLFMVWHSEVGENQESILGCMQDVRIPLFRHPPYLKGGKPPTGGWSNITDCCGKTLLSDYSQRTWAFGKVVDEDGKETGEYQLSVGMPSPAKEQPVGNVVRFKSKPESESPLVWVHNLGIIEGEDESGNSLEQRVTITIRQMDIPAPNRLVTLYAPNQR